MALHDLPRKQLAYEDYVLFPDDGKRHEIIDGEHYVTAAPFVRHQRIVVHLTVSLGSFLRQHPLGELLVAPTDVVLSPNDVLQPDLLFISNERAAIVRDENIQGAPDLVIEILSKSTHQLDKIVKRDAYEHWGVLEYWMFDPFRKGADVWERNAGELLRSLSAAAGDVLTTPLLPGLEIPLTEVFKG